MTKLDLFFDPTKCFIGGRWVAPVNGEYLPIENPSTGAVIAQVPLSSADDVSAATRAAAIAFRSWREQPAARRVQYLFRLAERMRADEDRLCRILVSEMGKSLPDAHAEMKRAIENLEVACGMPVLQQGDLLVGASAGMDGMVIREPIGVFAGIMPSWKAAGGAQLVAALSIRNPRTVW